MLDVLTTRPPPRDPRGSKAPRFRFTENRARRQAGKLVGTARDFPRPKSPPGFERGCLQLAKNGRIGLWRIWRPTLWRPLSHHDHRQAGAGEAAKDQLGRSGKRRWNDRICWDDFAKAMGIRQAQTHPCLILRIRAQGNWPKGADGEPGPGPFTLRQGAAHPVFFAWSRGQIRRDSSRLDRPFRPGQAD